MKNKRKAITIYTKLSIKKLRYLARDLYILYLTFIISMKLSITCPYWWWGLLSKEIKQLWYKPTDTHAKWTYLEWDITAISKISIWSRVANKIYIILAEKNIVHSFDWLFDAINEIKWSNYISWWQNIRVRAFTSWSILKSEKTIQSITLKAITKKLTENNQTETWKIDEEQEPAYVEVVIADNKFMITLNTSWRSLHERWYRQEAGMAPIKENIAAALVLQSWRKFSDPLWDPFCWSWTIAIEAAMIARNIAPWLKRHFAFENLPWFDHKEYQKIKEEAKWKQFNKHYTIIATDIDDEMTVLTKANAKKAWVDDTITAITHDFVSLKLPKAITQNNETDTQSYHIVTNPPYWNRINPEEINSIYSKLVELWEKWTYTWWFITLFEPILQNKDSRITKPCYNWRDKCTFYKTKKPGN